jgi:Geminivirus Rep catalytic domain
VFNTTERIQMKKEKIKKILKRVKKVEKKKNKTFRLQGKHLFLTYPQVALSREEALEQIKEKVLPRRIEEYVISTEKHSTGTEHLHVYVKLDKASDIENKNRLDLETEGKEGKEKKHGNYQSCRSYNNVVNYIIKGGRENVLTNMDLDDLGREKNI